MEEGCAMRSINKLTFPVQITTPALHVGNVSLRCLPCHIGLLWTSEKVQPESECITGRERTGTSRWPRPWCPSFSTIVTD